jgi:hypothetical protein
LSLNFFRIGAPLLILSAVLAWAPASRSASSADADAQRWVAAKFAGKPEAAISQGYVIVRASHTVFKNEIKGHALRIANTQYQKGINASVGTVTVHLPGGGASFAAVIGVDSNDVGYYSNAGRGAVVASVGVEGKKVFTSAVLHEGMVGVPLKVGLGGATEPRCGLTGYWSSWINTRAGSLGLACMPAPSTVALFAGCSAAPCVGNVRYPSTSAPTMILCIGLDSGKPTCGYWR